ncbi:MAG: sigma-54-dependent Fis family transcriptional regulator [Deltaproteobacteria bacterium]|nr:sigma-54-dependent Fis family transcriptional regulator [Deltaproteobacteria bacterium]
MTFLTESELRQIRALARLFRTNPFRDERQELEKEVLQNKWHHPLSTRENSFLANQKGLEERTKKLTRKMNKALLKGVHATKEETKLYREMALVCLYDLFADRLDRLLDGAKGAVPFYREFKLEFEQLFQGLSFDSDEDPAHIFALFFQLRRAFHHIFRFLLGSSTSTANLRAEVWDSIFTHDIARYRRGLFSRLQHITTLVLGDSGTGKELVARAIGFSQYVPFDVAAQSFQWEPQQTFLAVHLSALSPTLLESELFGHRRGAFTDAITDRVGRLEACPAHGAVFLDEIGDIDPTIQVKLLRVLETRNFSPVGTTEIIPFRGKIIAATHRDLSREVEQGRFREDLFYRLNSDRLRTPTLATRIQENRSELPELISFLSTQAVGKEDTSELAEEVLNALKSLPKKYSWPGNVRELAQAVRQVLIRGVYRPQVALKPAASTTWLDAAAAGTLDMDGLVEGYAMQTYRREGNYEAAARILGIDRRTVKTHVSAAQNALNLERSSR